MNTKLVLLTLVVVTVVAACGRRQPAPPIPANLVQLCGDPGLAGIVLPAIESSGNACGIQRPVEVHFVSGVALSAKTVLNCDTARSLREWVDGGAQPAMRSLRARITNLQIGSSYACRTRNSRPGAKISEHATGNAIDIVGLTLDTGERVSVLDGWRSKKFGPALRAMYSAACGTFSTTLGPDSDRFHQDNIHFDGANYRGGTYCR